MPFLLIGTELLRPSFKNDLREDLNGKSNMEAARPTIGKGAAQSKFLIQVSSASLEVCREMQALSY
ncbi:hypothetical protein ACVWY5_001484 [Bradyrhizobium sp. USDA 3256]